MQMTDPKTTDDKTYQQGFDLGNPDPENEEEDTVIEYTENGEDE